MEIYYFENKKIGILGLKKTGISSFRYFQKFTQFIFCYDDDPKTRDIFISQKHILSYTDIKWKSLDYILVSPGIRNDHQVYKLFQNVSHNDCRPIIISDIEVFIHHNLKYKKDIKYICVTGTNGKSTTTSLITHILNSSGKKFTSCGNIGNAVLDIAYDDIDNIDRSNNKRIAVNQNIDTDGYVMELSSFQLDIGNVFVSGLSSIRILLNIAHDHMDRYESMQCYINSKRKIFNNFSNETHAIICIDDEYTMSIYNELSQKYNYKHNKNVIYSTNIEQDDFYNLHELIKTKKIISISTKKTTSADICVVRNKIYFNITNNLGEPASYDILLNNKCLLGDHNFENIAAALVACIKTGISLKQILTSINSFKGLPHRIEHITDYKNLTFINDSKATNVHASSKAIKLFSNIYLLAGGIAKSSDIDDIIPYIGNIKRVYLYGQDKTLLYRLFAQYTDIKVFNTLKAALKESIYDALKDELLCNILLSPMCGSYDQFKSFEDRGNVFRDLVTQYVNNQ